MFKGVLVVFIYCFIIKLSFAMKIISPLNNLKPTVSISFGKNEGNELKAIYFLPMNDPPTKIRVENMVYGESDTIKFMVHIMMPAKSIRRLLFGGYYVLCSLMNIEVKELKNGFDYNSLPDDKKFISYKTPDSLKIKWGLRNDTKMRVVIIQQFSNIAKCDYFNEEAYRIITYVEDLSYICGVRTKVWADRYLDKEIQVKKVP